jgi:alanyl-tRNA synthetase
MYTKNTYQENVYFSECQSIITSIIDVGDQKALTFQNTVFFPTGGGQSCDLGSISNDKMVIFVTDVYESDGEIFHVISGDAEGLAVGDEVTLKIDWPRRFDNMQRHCGEHLLTGAFVRLFGGINKGFHMGDDYITIDIAFAPDSRYDRVTWEMAAAAELEANKNIWADVPVTVDYFDKREDAEKLPLRKALAFDEDISIVTIGDKEKPLDCVACCGTHPSSTGQIGLIKIYKIEPNKGMSRIFFEAGQRAYAHYCSQFNSLYDLGNRLSAGYADILSKYDAQQEKNQEIRDRLHGLTGYFVETQTSRILADLEAGRRCSYEYDLLTPDDILKIGKGLENKISAAVAIADTATCTLFLFSDGTVPCGSLIKKHAGDFGGRGGGRDTMARAVFPDMDSLHGFLNKIFS